MKDESDSSFILPPSSFVPTVPPSSTRAMLGWSIRARACRSASKRAMTCFESIPTLISLSATNRLTGSVCWAIQTVPMPPSPIASSSLYGPISVPDCSQTAPSTVATGVRGGGAPCRKLPAASCARISASTRARRSASPAQAFPRKAARSSGDRYSTASPRIEMICRSGSFMTSPLALARNPVFNAGFAGKVRRAPEVFSGILLAGARPVAQELVQPGPGVGPVAVGGSSCQAEGHGRLVERQAGEEAELDQFRTHRVFPGQALEGIVEGDEVLVRGVVHGRQRVQIDALPTAAALETALLLGAVDEEAAHGLGTGGEEVAAAVPVPFLSVPDQAQVGLVTQGCRLEGLAGPLAGQLLGGEPPQLLVDQWQELAGGVRVALLVGRQDPRDLVHTWPSGGARRTQRSATSRVPA